MWDLPWLHPNDLSIPTLDHANSICTPDIAFDLKWTNKWSRFKAQDMILIIWTDLRVTNHQFIHAFYLPRSNPSMSSTTLPQRSDISLSPLNLSKVPPCKLNSAKSSNPLASSLSWVPGYMSSLHHHFMKCSQVTRSAFQISTLAHPADLSIDILHPVTATIALSPLS